MEAIIIDHISENIYVIRLSHNDAILPVNVVRMYTVPDSVQNDDQLPSVEKLLKKRYNVHKDDNVSSQPPQKRRKLRNEHDMNDNLIPSQPNDDNMISNNNPSSFFVNHHSKRNISRRHNRDRHKVKLED